MIWKWKRPAAFLLAAAMIFTMPGVPASAVEAGAIHVYFTGFSRICKHFTGFYSHPPKTKIFRTYPPARTNNLPAHP